jgi:hypothetical protein
MRDLAGVAAVPEPATCVLAGVGVMVCIFWRRRRRPQRWGGIDTQGP